VRQGNRWAGRTGALALVVSVVYTLLSAGGVSAALASSQISPSGAGTPGRPVVADPTLTPGASDPNVTEGTVRGVCAAGVVSMLPPVTDAMKRAVFTRYGIPKSLWSHFLVAEVVPPPLGGTVDVPNLWPEAKERADDRAVIVRILVDAVCAGDLDLAPAQWVATAGAEGQRPPELALMLDLAGSANAKLAVYQRLAVASGVVDKRNEAFELLSNALKKLAKPEPVGSLHQRV
jgi:hypothetical protein